MRAAAVQIATPENTVSAPELMNLAMVNNNLFCSEFFPNTVRQAPAKYHEDVWRLLESSARQINIQMHREAAKTSLLRMYMAKRIAYGLSRTILYVGLSQDKALQSTSWLRKQIEHNRKFSGVFKLTPGAKWQDSIFTIDHGIEGHSATILAYGVTGSVRGVNIDDYRPDLIILDDILNEENTATEDQRKKMEGLIYGALLASLAPPVDAPDAKLTMLQTPLNREDASTKALKDPAWVSAQHGCWSPETQNLPDSEKESAWPERHTTEDLRSKKASFLTQNRASVWYREYEVKITSPETSSFKDHWLKYYELPPERKLMRVVGAIDPVPPPTDIQIKKGMKGKDYEVLAILGLTAKNDIYLLEYSANRGHEPNWTEAEFFRLGLKWRPATWVVEVTGYQKTLEYLLRKAMRDEGIYFPVYEFPDKRGKYDRIVDSYAGPASNGAFYVHETHTEFIQQFNEYPDVTHDDILDAVSMGIVSLPPFGVGEEAELSLAVDNVSGQAARKINYHYGAP